MENNFDGIILTINGYDLELQQSVINWLILCALFAFLFIWAGKKFERCTQSTERNFVGYGDDCRCMQKYPR